MNKFFCREQLKKKNIGPENKEQRIKLLRENLFALQDDCKINYGKWKKTLEELRGESCGK
ncbi:hypothetical protein [Halanaerobium congolense]|jgi:hypothetical protein|uniref:Uncharacterized protein n=1 Tax=Halanaerobium congolense TaxID=54121 RepID=A0A1G6MTI8_9FIRM|nr:hypothetical protein [Halanaerobium congolense]TDX43664.1 hypothetical protein C7954_11545 [Halanaerobium congolense]SDC58554.1 hypothetical protein SAMN04488597_10960 [Halanaerobium congolense]SDL00430.1 hypothetical protein SAMN04515655_14114 [Halanaerobium congolense]SDN04720.1 hypothetical protein SAMN04488599_14315 [Halanaerobium congolense]SHN11437.1 hypothetical protein SAMN04515650_12422 [Halanaerobium congolense]